MTITKAELLWSRACPLSCAGCAMPTPTVPHQGTPEDWDRGVRRLAELGARFVALYGAEPLARPEGLAEVIRSLYAAGLAMTLITALPRHPLLRALLDTTPLDSLTCSWDGVTSDPHRQAKGRAGWDVLRRYPQIRDRAVVATVTRENADLLPTMAREATAEGVWFMFDLYHPHSGPFSKCSDRPGLAPPTPEQVRRFVPELLALKARGLPIHASAHYLETLLARYDGHPRHLWHCYGTRPGWVTLDADGSILPCDDYQVRFPHGKVWDPDWTPDQLTAWIQAAVKPCAGCAWNTHYDAAAIAEGVIDLGTYVH